jgi:hypothetical protein
VGGGFGSSLYVRSSCRAMTRRRPINHRVRFTLAGGWGDVFCDFSKVWRCMARWEVDSVPRCWFIAAAGHGSVDGVRLGWKKYLCCIFCLL